MATLNRDDRALLAAVITRHVIRNVIGGDEVITYEGGQPTYEVVDYTALNRLRDAGLIALPDGRGERYWEITDKALEG